MGIKKFNITQSLQINMKLVAATIACLGMSTQAALPSRFDEGAAKFAEFKRNHGKFYKDLAEESRRLAIFKENLAFIARHNMDFLSGRETFSVGINKFTDLTNSEYPRDTSLKWSNPRTS